MSKPKYHFSAFSDLRPFDILSNQEVLNRYNFVEQNLLSLSKSNNKGYYNIHLSDKNSKSGQVNSYKKSLKEYSKSIHKPYRFLIKPESVKENIELQPCKSDLNTMDLVNIDILWDHWVYLTLPKEFILSNQKYTLDNNNTNNISIFKNYINEVIDNNLTDTDAYSLQLEYDKKYPDLYISKDRLPRPGWRFDNKISQVLSVRESGIFFPIAYNNHADGSILERGTHRALVFASLGYDVPIFVQHPELGGSTKITFNLKTNKSFSNIEHKITVDLKNKKLSYE